jgi:hypothetical protein
MLEVVILNLDIHSNFFSIEYVTQPRTAFILIALNI